MLQSFNNILNNFKRQEALENVVVLVDDTILQKAILGWPSVRIQYNYDRDTERISDDCSENDQWEALWEAIKFDMDDFALSSGCRASDTESVFLRLKRLHLIYPDGSMGMLARKYLQSLMANELRKNMPKPERERKEKPEKASKEKVGEKDEE